MERFHGARGLTGTRENQNVFTVKKKSGQQRRTKFRANGLKVKTGESCREMLTDFSISASCLQVRSELHLLLHQRSVPSVS